MSKFASKLGAIRIDAERPGRMIIMGFNGEPLRDERGMANYIDLYSIDSPTARHHAYEVTAKRIAERRRGKLSAKEWSESEISLYSALTAGWGEIDKDGAAVPDPDFSAAAARELYADPDNAELRSQVEQYVYDRQNFLKTSPVN